MVRTLHIFGWLICVVYSIIPGYWLLIHPHAEYWRAQRSPYRVLLPLWAGMFVVVLGITAPFRKLTVYHTAWSWLPAAALFAVGIWLYKTGSVQFSLQRLQGVPELRREHTNQQLVTSGIRARIRHPIYLAHFSEMLAWTIGTGLVVCVVLSALSILGGIFLIRAEDAELEQRFGDPYRQYRKSVPALFPRLGTPRPRL